MAFKLLKEVKKQNTTINDIDDFKKSHTVINKMDANNSNNDFHNWWDNSKIEALKKEVNTFSEKLREKLRREDERRREEDIRQFEQEHLREEEQRRAKESGGCGCCKEKLRRLFEDLY